MNYKFYGWLFYLSNTLFNIADAHPKWHLTLSMHNGRRGHKNILLLKCFTGNNDRSHIILSGSEQHPEGACLTLLCTSNYKFMRDIFLSKLPHKKIIHLLFCGRRELLFQVVDALASLQNILSTLQHALLKNIFLITPVMRKRGLFSSFLSCCNLINLSWCRMNDRNRTRYCK